MDLSSGDAKKIGTGLFGVTYANVSGGDVKLQKSTDGQTFIDIPDSTQSADSVFNIEIDNCVIKASITGSANVKVRRIRH